MLKKLMLVTLFIAVLLPARPYATQAQESGRGRPIAFGNIQDRVVSCPSFNPLNSHCRFSFNPFLWMFPGLVRSSAFTHYFGKAGEEGVHNALATDWTISDDGRVYTFTLRQDAIWSDGTPITATDVKFTYDAMGSGAFEARWNPYYDPITNPYGVQAVHILDNYTVQLEFGEGHCDENLEISSLSLVPAHVFGYSGQSNFDFSVIADHPYNTNPSVVYGPFGFDEVRPDTDLILKPVHTWAEGPVMPAGLILRDVEDYDVQLEQLQAGELDVVYLFYPMRNEDLEELFANPHLKTYSVSTNWDSISLNLADPTNPQPGLNENGDIVDQGHHPIFGDKEVRRALQYALDVPAIIDATGIAGLTPMVSYLLRDTRWVWVDASDLQPIPYDPVRAAQMLDDAGWPVGPNGQRVCQDCRYAEEGTPLAFEMLTNAANYRRVAQGIAVQNQLADLGIAVDLKQVPFPDLVDQLVAQTFDSILVGTSTSWPYKPDPRGWVDPAADVPGAYKWNNTSYYSPAVVRLAEEAATLSCCDQDQRIAMYHEIERLIQEDQPFLWQFSIDEIYAAHADLQGWDPRYRNPLWNIQMWMLE